MEPIQLLDGCGAGTFCQRDILSNRCFLQVKGWELLKLGEWFCGQVIKSFRLVEDTVGKLTRYQNDKLMKVDEMTS